MFFAQYPTKQLCCLFHAKNDFWIGLGTETRYQYVTGTYVTGMY